MYYNFYEPFTLNGEISVVPNIKLERKRSDEAVTWQKGLSRMDIVSNDYYGHPYGSRLILAANQEYTNENDIPDGATIVIPLPYKESVQEYIEKCNKYKRQYDLASFEYNM